MLNSKSNVHRHSKSSFLQTEIASLECIETKKKKFAISEIDERKKFPSKKFMELDRVSVKVTSEEVFTH